MDATASASSRARQSSTATAVRPHHVLGTALGVGIVGNLLVQAPGAPGLNLFLFFVALAAGVALVTRLSGRTPSGEAWGLMAGGVLLSGGSVLRASEHLQLAAFAGAAVAFALAALHGGRAWLRWSGVGDPLEAVVSSAVHAGLGIFRLAAVAIAPRDPGVEEAEDLPLGRGAAVLRGLLLALPLLLVFGGLFMAADPVFSRLVTGWWGIPMEELASHVAVTLVLSWLAAGWLTGFLTGTRVRELVAGLVRRPGLGMVEVGIALGLLALLFGVFVAVQFRYLFGGAQLVEVTPGLTYAEYAREGFGQLAFASALVLPTLLVSDWLLERRNRRDHAWFRALGGVQLLLLGVVILSAFHRVRAYQEAYGLTESRFYGGVFLGWLLVVAAWFAVTVLRGRRADFAFPALLSVFALVAALLAVNPDARIARTNLQRAGVPEGAGIGRPYTAPPLDVAYLGRLSADAVPVLLDALPHLDPGSRCQLAASLLERWGGDTNEDWRNWNRAVARARGAVGEAAATLRRMAGAEASCPER